MADVFISYSRKDGDFVRKLHNSLAKFNRDTWVDWRDIPLTADFLNEIHAGIEGADNFVFVISPESVSSRVCQEEIAYAAKNNKRLIPILHRYVPDEEIPDPIARLQWIFFRDSDDFELSFAALMETLDTDLDWKRAHTRLLVRASEWERRARESSLMLRGTDLQEAEQWLANAPQNESKPTSLQGGYIAASRRAAAGRQRITLGAVTVALLVAIALALIAWNQRNLAIKRQQDAEARRLVATSMLVESSDPELSVLIAAQGITAAWSSSHAILPEL